MDQNVIPVHVPKLPTSDLIKPYLDAIDAARWYSNFGPLVKKFEARLADHFHIEPEMILTVANGTLALISMLKMFEAPENSLCIMPSWTFVATASAACYAGMVPYFVDVDPVTQALDPKKLQQELATIKKPIGAVIVVAPFGAPINRQEWDDFTHKTGIPVIIDAAAGFDAVGRLAAMRIGKTPMMISLHATKVMGIGEGGLLLSTDVELIRKVKASIGFGFNAHREALLLGYNAKLSEYSAAVGLAALDIWPETRQQWAAVRDLYIKHLTAVGIQHCFSADWITSTCNVVIPNQADEVAQQLKTMGIDTRKWWLNGCHPQLAYRHFSRAEKLDATEWLGRSVLGLPSAVDLSEEKIERICEGLKIICKKIDADTKTMPLSC